MFCVLRYLQVSPAQLVRIDSSVLNAPRRFPEGVNKNLLFNPDCYVQILLDYFSSETDFDQTQDFVLCDDAGSIIDVKVLKPWMNASALLPPFKVYYLVAYERDEVGYTNFEPFLNRKSKECADLLGKLRGYLTSGKSNGKTRVKRSSEDALKRRRRSNGSKSSCSAGSGVVCDDKGKKKPGDKSLRRRKAQG